MAMPGLPDPISPPSHDPLRRAIGEGEDGEDGVETAVGDVGRAVGDKEIVVAVDATVGIDDGGTRIVAHAAGAGLVLAAVQIQARRVAPGLDRAGRVYPVARAVLQEGGGADGLLVGRAGEVRDR